MRLSRRKLAADGFIELSTCGMGMPVIRANQKLRGMEIGAILEISSAHP